MLAIFLEARRFRFKIEFLIDTKVGSYDQNGKGTRNFFLLEHLERGDSPFVTALRWRARKDEVKTLKENRFLISLGASAVGFSSPLFFFSFSVSLSFSFFVGEEYGDACDVLGSTARSMSIACTYIYECNVDRCMIGYVNDRCGGYLATRDSLIPFIRNRMPAIEQLITLNRFCTLRKKYS